jgi:hypothetical protein
MLAAADTFRAAAREQLAVWADRADLPASAAGGRVDIVSQEGGDPAGVTFRRRGGGEVAWVRRRDRRHRRSPDDTGRT